MDMAREEITGRLEKVLETDRLLTTTFGLRDLAKVELFLDPLLKEEERKVKTKSTEESPSKVQATKKRPSLIRSDPEVRTLLANLVYKANFLVEENLKVN